MGETLRDRHGAAWLILRTSRAAVFGYTDWWGRICRGSVIGVWILFICVLDLVVSQEVVYGFKR